MKCIRFKIIFDKDLYILHKSDPRRNSYKISFLNMITSNGNYNKKNIDIDICTTKDVIFFTENPNLDITLIKKYYNVMDIIASYPKNS